ncbi:MAG: ParA family protein [Nitrospirae bacterium]|nr:ParA family protein [Nitrospirota bacterium]
MNEKGGSGKTTLAVHCAAFFALQKRRVLLVDMDPQGHAGKALGKDVNALSATLLDALVGAGIGLGPVVRTTAIAGLDLAPCNKTMSDFALNAFRHPDRHLKLSHTLREAAAYDAVFIDSPPSLSLLTINILMAAEEIVIPVSCTYLALDGCAEILKTIQKLKSHFPQKKLDIVLVVPTLFRDTPVARAVVDRLGRYFGSRLSADAIPHDDTVDQAQSYGQTLFQFAPESLTTQAFTRIGSRLLAGRIGHA